MKPIQTEVKASHYLKGGKEQVKKVIPARKNLLPPISTPIVICDQKTIDVLVLFYSLFEKQIKENISIEFIKHNLTKDQIQLIKEVRKDVLT